MKTTNRKSQPVAGASDLLQTLIEAVVESGIRKALAQAAIPQLLSVKETAEHLSLSTHEVYNMISLRKIPAIRHGKRVLIDANDLTAFIHRKKMRAEAE